MSIFALFPPNYPPNLCRNIYILLKFSIMTFAPHFSEKELTTTTTGFKNVVSGNNRSRLVALSHKLEHLRGVVGKPLYINSAYRSEEVNRAVGGARRSHHLYGCAADISLRNLSLSDRVLLDRAIIDSKPCEYIRYDTFVHVAYDFSRIGVRDGRISTWEDDYPELFVSKSHADVGNDATDL